MERHLPFALTALLVLLGLAGTNYLQTQVGFPSFLLLVPIVIFTSGRWGALVGAFAAAMTTSGMVLLMAPAWTLTVASRGDRARVIAFIVVATVCVALASRQHRLEQRLRQSEREFRGMFELAAVGASMVDPRTGRFTRVNSQLCAITGYSEAELLSKTVADITHPDDRARDAELMASLLRGERGRFSMEKRYVRKNGEVIWTLVNGTTLRDEHGTVSRSVAHVTDISTRRKVEQELRKASRIKDEFMATLSHELRTPLNVIVGRATLLLKQHPEAAEPLRRAVSIIERNATDLQRLTDDLLTLSETLTGRVLLEETVIDLPPLVADVVENMSLAAKAKGITVTMEVTAGLRVRGDQGRLRQVFWNLLSNAIKFTPPGGRIAIEGRRAGDQARVRVTDSGIGITAEFLPYVFDKFRQEDASATREHYGLGVGLALVRQFVELHGGRIAAESSGRDQGATFTVTLPLTAEA